MSVLDKLYNIVKKLIINDDNEEKCYGVSNYFIQKLSDLVSLSIGEKLPTNITFSKMYCWSKLATLTRLYLPVYLELDDYPPYSDKNQSFWYTYEQKLEM